MKKTTTKTARRQAVMKVFSLVKEGHSVTAARKLVGKEIDRNANTLWVWQDELNLTTPVVNNDKIATHTNNTAIARKITIDPSIPRAKDHLSRVLTSLVSKNGEYSTKEASAISQVSSGILGLNKHELEVAKFLNKNLIRTGK